MGWSPVIYPSTEIAACSELFHETIPSDIYSPIKPLKNQVYSESKLSERVDPIVKIDGTTSKPSGYTGSAFELYLFKGDGTVGTLNKPEIALAFDLSIKRNKNALGKEIIEFYHWHIHVGLNKYANTSMTIPQIYSEVKSACDDFLKSIQSYSGTHELYVMGDVESTTVTAGEPIDDLLLAFIVDRDAGGLSVNAEEEVRTDANLAAGRKKYRYFDDVVSNHKFYRQEITSIP